MAEEVKTVWSSPQSSFNETGMAIALGKSSDGILGVGVINAHDDIGTFVIISREDLISFRDALTKELVQ